MKAIVILGIITLVLGFLIIQLDNFPALGVEASPSPSPTVSTEEFSVELAREAGDKFSSVYDRVITDLTSFADDPDGERAQRHRESMMGYATALIPSFQNLVNTLQGNLDELNAEAMQEAGSTTQ